MGDDRKGAQREGDGLPAYFVYILTCEDGSLYTGITTDITRRMAEHLSGKGAGARYTRSHRPVELSALWRTRGRSAASALEYRIKRLSHAGKQALIASPEQLVTRFGKDIPAGIEVVRGGTGNRPPSQRDGIITV